MTPDEVQETLYILRTDAEISREVCMFGTIIPAHVRRAWQTMIQRRARRTQTTTVPLPEPAPMEKLIAGWRMVDEARLRCGGPVALPEPKPEPVIELPPPDAPRCHWHNRVLIDDFCAECAVEEAKGNPGTGRLITQQPTSTMATEYWQCGEDVHEMAREIIEAHHPNLIEAGIIYLFRDKAPQRAGKTICGTASKVSAKENAIARSHYAFKIEIAFDVWTLQTDEWRRALLDHELCHCTGDAEEGWEIVGHDLEEFTCIVERHGLWRSDVEAFLRRAEQLELFA